MLIRQNMLFFSSGDSVINWITLLYKHNGICMHAHCAEVLLPSEYVNEALWVDSCHKGQNSQLPHKQICPQMSFKPAVIF